MPNTPQRQSKSRKTAAREAAASTTTAKTAKVSALPASVRDELAARMVAVQSAALVATLNRETGVPASKTDVAALVAAFATSDGVMHVEGATLASLREAAGDGRKLAALLDTDAVSVSASKDAADKAAQAGKTVRVYRRGRSIRVTVVRERAEA